MRHALSTLVERIRVRLREPERGSAVLEFLVVGVLLTLPVFYLVITLSRMQAGAYAVSGAAREAGRMYVTASDDASAAGRADAGAALVFADHGLSGDMTLACSASPCLTRGAQVTVRTAVDVDLPLVPDFLGAVVPTSVRMTSTHVESVGKYRE
ncbi:pilus assembly protein [Yimella sp. NH-Cas1]|uniref:pilus assembly protein n=1 Tax=Yimella sp. NH-Cas1 TaxID=2917726 RepID=UPI001EFBE5C5|nr:pilus assembly protein [Yimella sp. NH-Cas1]MCG8655949.1 pilus assembly protein [Yimella sp. NH-Cas1]